jgi:hypothetical protein
MIAHHDKVAWSGIWIDMSEVSSFCVGSCGTGNLSLNPVHPSFSLPGEPGAKIYTYPEDFDKTNKSEAAVAASLSSSQSASVAKATPPSTQTTPYFVSRPLDIALLVSEASADPLHRFLQLLQELETSIIRPMLSKTSTVRSVSTPCLQTPPTLMGCKNMTYTISSATRF